MHRVNRDNLATRAARAAQNRLGPNTGATPSTPTRPGTNLLARTERVAGRRYVCRKNRLGGRKGQWRDSTGGTMGAWNRSAAGEMRRTGDRRWDQTVSSQEVGGWGGLP